MAKRSKMAGDAGSKRKSAAVKPGTEGSIRGDLNFLFETQEMKKKKENKRSSKPKLRSRKQDVTSVKRNKDRTQKGKDLTASETLSKKSREKTREVSEPENSDNEEEQHSVSQTRQFTKPSASKRALVSRAKQLKRFAMPVESSPSSSATSLSQGSDYVQGSLRSQSCSSVSSSVSGSSEPRQEQSRSRCQTIKATNPSTSGQTSRPKFKRRNSPHPRLLKAKRAKTQKRNSRSRSTASSASRKSTSNRRQVRERCPKPIKRSATSTKSSKVQTHKRAK